METDGQLSSNSDSSVQSADKPLEGTNNLPNGPESMEVGVANYIIEYYVYYLDSNRQL